MNDERLRELVRNLSDPQRRMAASADLHSAIFELTAHSAVKNDHAAREDVTQSVCLALFRNGPSAIEHPRAYLNRAVRNEAISHIRKVRATGDVDTLGNEQPRTAAREMTEATLLRELDDAWTLVRTRALEARAPRYREALARDLDQIFALSIEQTPMDEVLTEELAHANEPPERRTTARNRLFKRHQRARDHLFTVIDTLEQEGLAADTLAQLRMLGAALYRCQPRQPKRVSETDS